MTILNSDKVLGIDPSLKSTGLAVFIKSTKTFKISKRTQQLNANKNFSSMLANSMYLAKQILKVIPPNIEAVSEIPPPVAFNASNLYMFDSILLSGLVDKGCEVSTVSPMLIAHTHRRKKYNKSDTVELTKRIISFLETKGYTFQLRANHATADEADAFIILLNYLVFKKYIVEPKLADFGAFDSKSFSKVETLVEE